MADVFYTILIAWVLWKIFGGTSTSRVNVFHHHQNQPSQKEGEVKISSTQKNHPKKNNDEGEYVDFEEVK